MFSPIWSSRPSRRSRPRVFYCLAYTWPCVCFGRVCVLADLIFACYYFLFLHLLLACYFHFIYLMNETNNTIPSLCTRNKPWLEEVGLAAASEIVGRSGRKQKNETTTVAQPTNQAIAYPLSSSESISTDLGATTTREILWG